MPVPTMEDSLEATQDLASLAEWLAAVRAAFVLAVAALEKGEVPKIDDFAVTVPLLVETHPPLYAPVRRAISPRLQHLGDPHFPRTVPFRPPGTETGRPRWLQVPRSRGTPGLGYSFHQVSPAAPTNGLGE